SVDGDALPGREALPGIEAALLSAGLRSAWRLLPDEQIGVVGVPGTGAVQALGDALGRVAAVRIGVSPPYGSLRETPRAL
ncbi:PucR family transcriptional regulator, partial [Streptomyces sp. SID11385]|nr:PucR family transcriptional regulator [Streptomyces sp. SID11385]